MVYTCGVSEVVYSRDARQQLRRMPANDAVRIMDKVDQLAADPLGSNPNASPLKGGGFRLRVGDWRVLYEFDTDANQVQIAAVLPRGKAYR